MLLWDSAPPVVRHDYLGLRPFVLAKFAVTLCAFVMLTVHAAVPRQAPLQPPKVEPAPTAAVRVTDVPLAKPALHVLPQLILAGALVTVPLPFPLVVTLRL